jgi:hypothetical protein
VLMPIALPPFFSISSTTGSKLAGFRARRTTRYLSGEEISQPEVRQIMFLG